jgi:putative aldouronate transport system substrate-binding protein
MQKMLLTKVTMALLLTVCVTGCIACKGKDSSSRDDASKKLRYVAPGNDWAEQGKVLDLVNEKLKKDGFNIEVELVRIPWDAWDQKTNMMFSTGEEFEMIHVMQDVKSATVLWGMKAIQPLNDYIDKFPKLKETLSLRWPEFTVKGEILVVPVKPNYYISRDYGKIFYREDIFQEASGGIVPTTVDGVIQLAHKMQNILLDKTGTKCYTWTHALNRPMTWLHRTYQNVNDPASLFVVDNTLGIAQMFIDGTVKSFYESDMFKKDCAVYRRMYDEGLIDPDILTTDNEARANAGEYGKFIFGFETHDYQTETILVRNSGAHLGDFWLNPALGNIEYFGIYNGNAVPASCPDPTIALSFMDWLYGSEENYNLFVYGIEGETYNKAGPHLVEILLGPDGQALYHYDEWQIGNADFQRYDKNSTETMMKMFLDPVKGTNVRMPTVGFNFDSTGVANEMANLTNEIITSIYPIKFGLVDYDANISQAIQRLKTAGLEKVLAEYAAQYRVHYEENKELCGVFQK